MLESIPDPSGYDGICAEAQVLKTTPYDYLVVGSGAGGGPLAARLARSGMKVLLLEAGTDPGAAPVAAEVPSIPAEASLQAVRERDAAKLAARREREYAQRLYHCPGLHAAATEPHLHVATHPPASGPAPSSWDFGVRHFADEARQNADPKVRPDIDDPARKVVSYPRGSALGGSTAHHAMIAVYGADADWQRIAEITGDDSWAPSQMRAIYQRMERSHGGLLRGKFAHYWHWLLDLIVPGRATSEEHGLNGWLEVRTTDPKLALGDLSMLRLVLSALFASEGLGRPRVLWRWLVHLVVGRLFRDLDVNDAQTMRVSPEGAALVPLAIDHHGARRGARERVLETRRALMADQDSFAGCLHLATGILVEQVLFQPGAEGDPPQAVGVKFRSGLHLYRASHPLAGGEGKAGCCFATREVILCGGTFNTPQLLMLSGIGDTAHLREMKVPGITWVDGSTASPQYIHLEGVGRNLRDRCEVGVISEMDDDFASLRGVSFDLNDEADPQLKLWRARETSRPRRGTYTTNGAAIAILRRSPGRAVPKAGVPAGQSGHPPDLFMLGFPVAFRGYYPGWSKDLLSASMHGTGGKRNLWSWTILKAYSENTGSVRLRSADPRQQPEISFCSFGEEPDQPPNPFKINLRHDDLIALKWAVEYVRGLNRHAGKHLKNSDADAAEIQPGREKTHDSPELEKWIVSEAWGHHAAGTCRIGRDPWRAKTGDLGDRGAVLDSRFRVHGVKGLRVVDASAFPEIPGYFLAVPVYLIGEKAADTILDELSL